MARQVSTDNKTLLILPNKRSCSEFVNLPNFKNLRNVKVTAISDLSLSDISFLTGNVNFSKHVKQLFDAKASDIKYVYELISELKKTTIFGSYKFSTLIPIARSLKSLFDDLSKSDVSIQDVDLDEYSLSSHKQFSINFLKNFYLNFARIARNKNFFTKSELLKKRVEVITDLITQIDNKKISIILAGSTGSVDYVKYLIEKILQHDSGHLVIQGMQVRDSGDRVIRDPAALFHDLFIKINYLPGEVNSLCYEDFIVNSDNFYKLTQNIFANQIEVKTSLDIEQEDIDSVSLIRSQNEVVQAEKILSLVKEIDDKQRVVIIASQPEQVRLIKSFLNRSSVEFGDAQKITLLDNDFSLIFIAILKVIDEDFSAISILNLLNNKNISSVVGLKNIATFESQVLRVYRKDGNIDQYIESIEKDYILPIKIILSSIRTLSHQVGYISPLKLFAEISVIIENFVSRDVKSFFDQECRDVLDDFKDGLSFAEGMNVNKGELVAVFSQVMNFYSLNKLHSLKNIEIASTIESRFVDYDLVIISSCNQGVLPKIESDNWLSGKVRRDLGIESSERLFSLAAYDFCNLLNSKKVVLSYCDKISGSFALKSEFLTRLQITLKTFDIEINEAEVIKPSHCQLNIFNEDTVAIDFQGHLKTISASQVSTLIHKPYSFYAKNILKLKKVKEIDFKPSSLDFGIFMHHLLDNFTKDKNFDIDKDLLRNFYKFYHCQESKLIFLPRAQSTIASFKNINEGLSHVANYNELDFSMQFGNFKIKSKIDRASESENGYELYDYKTGTVPAKKDVLSGKELQMPLYALIFNEDKNKKVKILPVHSISYWKVGMKESKISKILASNDLNKFLDDFSKNLTEFFDFLASQKVSFAKSSNYKEVDDYYHLSRIKKQ